MSFRKISFQYTPPPTAQPQPLDKPVAQRNLPVVPDVRSSRAAKMIGRIDVLKATGRYLQDLIRARAAGIGIELNFNAAPDLAMALSRLYASEAPPPGITLEMYNNLLDAELGVMRAEMALADSNSPLMVQPLQKADLMQVTAAFEDALADTGMFRHQLPLLLRELKGDDIVFDSLRDGLQEYPILSGSEYQPVPETAAAVTNPDEDWYVPPDQDLNDLVDTKKLDKDILKTLKDPFNTYMPEVQRAAVVTETGAYDSDDWLSPLDSVLLDISEDAAAEVEARLDQYERNFGFMYNLATDIDQAYEYIHSIANTFLYQPLEKLILVLSTLRALKALFHKPKLAEIKGLIAMIIMPRLIGEVTRFNFLMDRILQRITDPVQTVLNSMNRLFGEISRVGNDVAYLTAQGGLTGIVRSQISGKQQMPTPARIKELDAIPKGTAFLGGKLSWALQQTRRQAQTIENSMLKAVDRRLQASGDRLEIMEQLRSIDSLVDILKSLILERQRGATQNSNQSGSTSSVAALGGLVNNLKTNSGTSFSLQGNTLVATPPNLPAPSAQVAGVLKNGGANRIDPRELISIQVK